MLRKGGAGLVLALGVALGADAQAHETKPGKANVQRQDNVDVGRQNGNADPAMGQGGLGTLGAQATSSEILGRLDKFEQKLNGMEQTANNLDARERDDVIDDIEDMREKANDTRERARAMERAKGDKINELRQDAQNAFHDLEDDYADTMEDLQEHRRGGF